MMRRETYENASIADALEQIGENTELVLAVEAFGERAVRCDANGFAFGSVGDEVRLLVPVRLAQAKPVHLTASSAVEINVRERPLGVAVLPGVKSLAFAVLEQIEDPFRRVPFRLILAENFVEVGIAVDGISANDKPGDFVPAKFNRREQSFRCRGRSIGALRQLGKNGGAGSEANRLFQKTPARCGRDFRFGRIVDCWWIHNHLSLRRWAPEFKRN